jgi:hypothetical protein
MALTTRSNGSAPTADKGCPGPPTPGPDREASGRFAKGNRGGPGNPFARQVAEFRKAIIEATTPEKIQAVVAKVEVKALEGDLAAVKIYLAYTVGRPTAAPDPDSLDVQEASLIQQERALMGLLAQFCTTPLLGVLLRLARATRPPVTDDFLAKFDEGLQAKAEEERAEAEEAEEEPRSGNGGDGAEADETPQEKAPAGGTDGEMPPSANGADGAETHALPPLPQRGPDKKAPSGNTQRGPRWVPPWEEEAGGGSLPPFLGG